MANVNAPTRADVALVARGLFESRTKAREAIAAGLVTADGMILRKASEIISPHAELSAERPYPWVSRGGVKLATALDAFGIDPRESICLDVGASTGGFTDVLLARGARQVHAIDVGRRQLHPRLRADPRVVAREGTDIRAVRADQFPVVDLAAVDVSFISLKLVLPAVIPLIRPGAALVALIKPQFEVGRAAVGKGVVRDSLTHAAVCDDIMAALRELGVRIAGIVPSPIAGSAGNREFLVGGRAG